MSQSILVTGAAGGAQGSTGRLVTQALIQRGLPVRALVHKLDDRSDRLRELGAEVVEGDLLNPASTRAALQGIRRAYFTYPVADGLMEATTIFAQAARDVGTELVVNLSQLQNTSLAASPRNLQHRLADQIFNWAEVGAVHLHAPPFYENVRAMTAKSIAEQDAIFLPWGKGEAIFPLVGAEDVGRVATALLASEGAPKQNAYDLIVELPTAIEIANTLTTVLHRPIRYVEITDEQWAQAVRERINAHAVDHLSHLWQFFRESRFGKGENGFRTTTSEIRALTGTEPQTLAEFFQKDALGEH
jgi:uncharacterized protein YbjT (DUF2867 family)